MFQPKNAKQHKHDCNDCTYLGTIREKGVLVDLYVHIYDDGRSATMDSFIARYGDTVNDYTSVSRQLVERSFMLTHACRQAWRIEQDRLEVGEVL